MNVNTAIQQVKDAGFNDAGDMTILGWINNAYGQLIDAAVTSGNDIDWLEDSYALSTTSGATVFASYPTNIAKIIGLWYTPASGQAAKIPYLDRNSFFERRYTKVSTPEGNATPAEFWTYYAGSIKFWPAASATVSNNYTLIYLKTPADLTLSGSIPMPIRYHQLLVTGALALAHRQDENDSGYTINHQMFLEGVEQMKADLSVKSLASNDIIGSPNSLGAMRREVKINGAYDLADSLIDTYINDAIYEFETCYPWEWLQEGPVEITATAGDQYLHVPSDIAKPVKLIDPYGYSLTYLNGDKFAKYTSAPSYTNYQGTPFYYTIWGYNAPADPEDPAVTPDGPTVMLYPVPSDAFVYRLWYIRNPRHLENVDDTVSFNREHRRIIMLSALCKAALATNNSAMMNKYQTYLAEYNNRLHSAMNDLSRPQYDNLDVVDNVDGYPNYGNDWTC